MEVHSPDSRRDLMGDSPGLWLAYDPATNPLNNNEWSFSLLEPQTQQSGRLQRDKEFRRASSGELNIAGKIRRGPCSAQPALKLVLDTRKSLLACSP